MTIPQEYQDHVRLTDAYLRGQRDAMSDKSPLFVRRSSRGIVPTIDDPMSDNWDNDAREAYLAGYDIY